MRSPRDLQFLQLGDGRVIVSWALGPDARVGDDVKAPAPAPDATRTPAGHDHPLGHLAPAEAHVLHLALSGLSNAAIAAQRGSRTRTVANQLARAYDKLGVSSRAEAAAVVDVDALAAAVAAHAALEQEGPAGRPAPSSRRPRGRSPSRK